MQIKAYHHQVFVAEGEPAIIISIIIISIIIISIIIVSIIIVVIIITIIIISIITILFISSGVRCRRRAGNVRVPRGTEARPQPLRPLV